MCGIACIFGERSEGFIERAKELLHHRGPDSNGVYKDEFIQILHTRLSILDLSAAGHQPMLSSSGRYVISFNGEIYNHLELRKKYFSAHVFRGHSDTETIVELFALIGEKMLAEMVGMWAIFIWDKQERRLFVSRDRYGQKPLYIARNNGQIAFASEIKPLLPLVSKVTIDYTMASEYAATGNYGHLYERTFFEQVKQVPPSHYCYIKEINNPIEWKAYWKIPVLPETGGLKADQEFLNELKKTVVEAVSSQTLADVSIGITLSGGIDSSIIAGILLREYPEKLHVFTAQAEGHIHDETKYVNAVLKGFEGKYILHTTNLNKLFSLEQVEELVRIQEEPFGDPSIIAHNQLMQLAAKSKIKVVLGGQGADEIFWGYDNLLTALLGKAITKPRLDILKDWMSGSMLKRDLKLRSLLIGLLPATEARMRRKSRDRRKMILPDEWLQQSQKTDNVSYSDLDAVWHESIRKVHIPHLVHYDDRNGMSVSVEGRMPFLDHRILELIAQLDPLEHINNGYRKGILRKACEEYMPDEIKNRKDKIGFFTPLKDFIVANYPLLKKFIDENNGKLFKIDVEKYRVETIGYEEILQLWRLYSLYQFAEKYIDKK